MEEEGVVVPALKRVALRGLGAGACSSGEGCFRLLELGVGDTFVVVVGGDGAEESRVERFIGGREVTLKEGAGVRCLIGIGLIRSLLLASESESDSSGSDSDSEDEESSGVSSPFRDIRRTPAPNTLAKSAKFSSTENAGAGKLIEVRFDELNRAGA